MSFQWKPLASPGPVGPHAETAAKVSPGRTIRNMAILTLPELAGALAPGQRLLGLDPGSKTVGIALSDMTRVVANPFESLKRRKFSVDVERLRAICVEHEVGGIVIGLPLNMNGSEGPRAQSARQMAANLTEALALPVALWDERLSTVAVERTLIEADLSRKKRARVIDKLAATYILQGALDALR